MPAIIGTFPAEGQTLDVEARSSATNGGVGRKGRQCVPFRQCCASLWQGIGWRAPKLFLVYQRGEAFEDEPRLVAPRPVDAGLGGSHRQDRKSTRLNSH